MKKHKVFLAFIFSLLMTNIGFSQAAEQAMLNNIFALDQQITEGMEKGEYHHSILDFNTNKKEWLGVSGYREVINCYFKILETQEMQLVRISIILEKEGEQAFINYTYSETERPLMCLNTYTKGEVILGSQTGFFGDQSILALSVNDNLVVGDNLSEEMVKMAREMYLSGEKYRQLFEKVMALQSL